MQSTHARKQAAKMTSSSLPPPFRPAAGDRALCINKYAEESIYISRLGRNKHCSIALSALTVSRIATFPVGDVAISAIPHVSLVRSSSNCWSERQRRVPAARECFSGSSSLERRAKCQCHIAHSATLRRKRTDAQVKSCIVLTARRFQFRSALALRAPAMESESPCRSRKFSSGIAKILRRRRL